MGSRSLVKWLLLVLLAIALVWWYRSGGQDSPDRALGKHFQNICKIAKSNVKKPTKGVKTMFKYFGDNSPDMLHNFGATLVEIERKKSDAAHDRRAEQARKRMFAPLVRCEETFVQFFGAVEQDEKASALLEHGINRFSRSLEIIFGNSADMFGPSSDELRNKLEEIRAGL